MTACEELRKPNGVVQFTETGYQTPTPWVSVRNQTFTQMHKMLTEFGMTPSSRSKINVPQEQEQVDPYEAFLGSETVKKKTRAASG